jgi:hypothetical protein
MPIASSDDLILAGKIIMPIASSDDLILAGIQDIVRALQRVGPHVHPSLTVLSMLSAN